MNVTTFPGDTGSRQADWRLLLPQSGRPFNHLVLIGGTPALEATIASLGIARRISHEPSPGTPADAVVVLAGAARGPEAAVAQLVEDGVLYWEIDRRTREHIGTTPARAIRRTSALGLTSTGSYWVKPGFPNRHMYLPLGAAGAFRWYLDTLYRTPTFVRRVVKTAARTAASVCGGVSAFAPCYAITAVRGVSREAALIELARKATQSIHRDNFEAVLLASGEADWNRIVVLLFEAGADRPTLALKIPRTAALNQQIEWEHTVLCDLSNSLTPPLRTSIPSSTSLRWNDLAMSIETCVPGASLNSRVQSGDAADDFHFAAEWLAEFHEHTSQTMPAREWLSTHLVHGLWARYDRTFGATDSERNLFGVLAHALESLDESIPLPIAWQHGDFGPWNIYRDGRSISVIDWEVARRGPALVDLLYFAMHWSAARARRITRAECLQHFESLFCRATHAMPAECAVGDEIENYMQRLSINPVLFPFLLVYGVVEQALDRAKRLGDLGAGASRADNIYCGHLDVLARHASELFSRVTSIASYRLHANATVAIATMNRPSALARCITAVINGTVKPAELIIVDQSSGTETGELVAAAGWASHMAVKYVRQPPHGLAASRNEAIALASRAIVAFTDDDCLPEREWLASIMRAFESAAAPDVVTGRVLPLGPDRPGMYAVSTRSSRVRAIYRGRALPWVVGSGGNTAARPEWLKRVGGFDERLGVGTSGRSAEDMDILYRLMRSGATMQYEPDAIVYHDRQDGVRRMASRPSYGFGMGAFCALWARQRDVYAVWMLSRWCFDRARALAASVIRRRWRRIQEEILMLRGAISGIAYGLTVRNG